KVGLKAKADDLWFVHRHYWLTPIYYYLREEDHRLVGHDYARALDENPRARVWVLGLDGLPPPPKVTEPLNHYCHVDRVTARGMYAALYLPATNPESATPAPAD